MIVNEIDIFSLLSESESASKLFGAVLLEKCLFNSKLVECD